MQGVKRRVAQEDIIDAVNEGLLFGFGEGLFPGLIGADQQGDGFGSGVTAERGLERNRDRAAGTFEPPQFEIGIGWHITFEGFSPE